MQQRRGTAAQWTTANPILAAGEIGFETDTSKFKMGNGSSAWSALQYYASAAELNTAISNLIDAAPGTLDTLNELAAAIGDDPAFFSNMASSIADSIDLHNGTTNVHGIANTALLATLTNVSTAQTAAEGFATTAVTNHKNATTNIHGIDDTAALAKTSEVSTAIGNAVTAHSSDTTEVHGITDTSALATKTYADSAVTTHSNDTSDVHGITNTADLATKTYADTAVSTHSDDTLLVHGISNTADLATKTYADTAVSTHQADTEDVHGISNTANLVYTADLTDHNNDTLDVHGISNTGNLAYLSDLTTHSDDTLLVHGIANTALLATQDYVDTAVGNSAVNQSLLAGVGIDWNEGTDQFDIDSTVATKTYVGDEIGTHNSDTTNVHGISDTANLVYTSDSRLSDERIPTNLSVTTGKIADDAVTADKIADNAISQSHMSDDSVGTNEIGGLAVTTAKIADGAVTTEKIATGAVTKAMVGLGNADNTSDASKPVSTATQTALDLKAPKADPTFTGTVTASNDLVVDGNLTVNGTAFNASSTSITIEDNMVQLAHQNTGNSVDLGLVVGYNDGAAKHSGIVRDVSADKWKLFKGVTTEPSTTVDFTQGSLDALQVAAFEATTVTASSGVVFSDGTQTKEGVPSRTYIYGAANSNAKAANYTLSSLVERDSLIEVSAAATITIPTDATLNYPIGTSIDILQTGTGAVVIAPVSGTVTVNATPGLTLRTQWSSATLLKRAANTWVVYGDLK